VVASFAWGESFHVALDSLAWTGQSGPLFGFVQVDFVRKLLPVFDVGSVVHPSFESEALAEVAPYFHPQWCLGVVLACQCGGSLQLLEGDLTACGLALRLKTGHLWKDF